eukprot:751089-Hanusia_phi.AAC.1
MALPFPPGNHKLLSCYIWSESDEAGGVIPHFLSSRGMAVAEGAMGLLSWCLVVMEAIGLGLAVQRGRIKVAKGLAPFVLLHVLSAAMPMNADSGMCSASNVMISTLISLIVLYLPAGLLMWGMDDEEKQVAWSEKLIQTLKEESLENGDAEKSHEENEVEEGDGEEKWRMDNIEEIESLHQKSVELREAIIAKVNSAMRFVLNIVAFYVLAAIALGWWNHCTTQGRWGIQKWPIAEPRLPAFISSSADSWQSALLRNNRVVYPPLCSGKQDDQLDTQRPENPTASSGDHLLVREGCGKAPQWGMLQVCAVSSGMVKFLREFLVSGSNCKEEGVSHAPEMPLRMSVESLDKVAVGVLCEVSDMHTGSGVASKATERLIVIVMCSPGKYCR